MKRALLIQAYVHEVMRFPQVNEVQANYLWHLMKDREKRYAIKKLETFDAWMLMEDRHDPR